MQKGRGEIVTLHKIGAPKGRVFVILASEVVLILAGSLLLAPVLTAHYGDAAIPTFLTS